MIIKSALGMFSLEPEVIVKQVYEYLTSKDYENVLSYFDDNAEIKKNTSIKKAHQDIKDNILHSSPQELYSSGNTVFAKGKNISNNNQSDFVHVHKIKNGKIILTEVYENNYKSDY